MITKKDLDIIPYDTACFLDSDEIMLLYLQDAMREGDKKFIKALETVARAKGITELARQTGLSRESLYKTLNGVTKPRFESIQKILAALNLKFTLAPADTLAENGAQTDIAADTTVNAHAE